MNNQMVRAIHGQQTIDGYIKPRSVWIGQEARALYAAEERRRKAIGACATEWAKVTDTPKTQYWKQSIPQVLFDTLNTYETGAALIAAEAFLEHHGYVITRPSLTHVAVIEEA